MNIIGVVAEYNPFHNGHLYHLNKIKELYPNCTIIVVLSGHFMQRGEPSIINKWDKTEIALHYGADLVIELPFPFATQSADLFAKGAIQILKHLKVDTLVFGSESNDLEQLIKYANIDLNNNHNIKQYLDSGFSYAKAIAEYINDTNGKSFSTPNDILGIAYIRAITEEHAHIKPITIKRTVDYHNLELNNDTASASSIRKALAEGKDVSHYVPTKTQEKLINNLCFGEDYFKFLKYKILSCIDKLDTFQTVDEGLENKIKKEIIYALSLEDLIMRVKTKRYTYNKIRRMFTHILVDFTKEEASKHKNITYLRVLGFNDNGQKYLNMIKKELNIPLITKFIKNNELLNLEFRATMIYASILNEENKIKLIGKEYKSKPVIKQ